jgi:hypothetical protein
MLLLIACSREQCVISDIMATIIVRKKKKMTVT